MLDLLAAGRRVGELVWLESRLFEVLGGWVATTPDLRTKSFFATASRHHGEHAELLSTALPEVAGGPTFEDLTAPPDEGDHLVDDLAALVAIGPTTERLDAWRHVLDGVMARMHDHLGATSAVAHAAVHRLVRQVIADELADLETSRRLG